MTCERSSAIPPPASSGDASRRMSANRRRDTGPELALRRALHRRGFRFRVDLPLSPATGRSVRADIVFPKRRVAVFVDGCFWHGCPTHGTMPKANREYWEVKIAENRTRDIRNTSQLEAAGWTVLRLWEHLDPEDGAAMVERALADS